MGNWEGSGRGQGKMAQESIWTGRREMAEEKGSCGRDGGVKDGKYIGRGGIFRDGYELPEPCNGLNILDLNMWMDMKKRCLRRFKERDGHGKRMGTSIPFLEDCITTTPFFSLRVAISSGYCLRTRSCVVWACIGRFGNGRFGWENIGKGNEMERTS